MGLVAGLDGEEIQSIPELSEYILKVLERGCGQEGLVEWSLIRCESCRMSWAVEHPEKCGICPFCFCYRTTSWTVVTPCGIKQQQ